jgi:hypothetical protein
MFMSVFGFQSELSSERYISYLFAVNLTLLSIFYFLFTCLLAYLFLDLFIDNLFLYYLLIYFLTFIYLLAYYCYILICLLFIYSLTYVFTCIFI